MRHFAMFHQDYRRLYREKREDGGYVCGNGAGSTISSINLVSWWMVVWGLVWKWQGIRDARRDLYFSVPAQDGFGREAAHSLFTTSDSWFDKAERVHLCESEYYRAVLDGSVYSASWESEKDSRRVACYPLIEVNHGAKCVLGVRGLKRGGDWQEFDAMGERKEEERESDSEAGKWMRGPRKGMSEMGTKVERQPRGFSVGVVVDNLSLSLSLSALFLSRSCPHRVSCG